MPGRGVTSSIQSLPVAAVVADCLRLAVVRLHLRRRRLNSEWAPATVCVCVCVCVCVFFFCCCFSSRRQRHTYIPTHVRQLCSMKGVVPGELMQTTCFRWAPSRSYSRPFVMVAGQATRLRRPRPPLCPVCCSFCRSKSSCPVSIGCSIPGTETRSFMFDNAVLHRR